MCQNFYPKSSSIVLVVILPVCLLNSITLLYLLFFSRKFQSTFLWVSILSGLLISLVLIAFHFYNQSTSSSSLVIFDHIESTKCKAIAYGYFALSFSFHYSNVLFFLTILLKLGNMNQMNGNKDEKYLLITLMTMTGVLLFLVMSPGNHQSPFCILQFTWIKKILINCFKGLLSLCVVVIIFCIQRKIRQSRKNSKRKEMKSEKILKGRMAVYVIGTTLSALLLFLQDYHPSPNKAVYFFMLYAECVLLPMSFPILFGLSTAQFRADVLSWMKKFRLD